MAYRLSPAARGDLRSIWLYTASVWGRPQANKYVLSIEMACGNIAEGLIRGRSAEHYRENYLSLAVGSHFIFYKMSDGGNVDVIRILHQRMDIASRLPT